MLFANFAEAMAEARGKAQADTLRKTKTDTIAKRIDTSGNMDDGSRLASSARGDIVLCEASDIIPGDGDVIEGIATRGRIGDHRRKRAGDSRIRRRPQRRHRRHKVLSDQIKIRSRRIPARRFSTA